METGPAVDLWLNEATYRDPAGRQRQATEAWGPYQLGTDSTASVVLVFAEVEPDGQVTLGGADSADFTPFDLELQVG